MSLKLANGLRNSRLDAITAFVAAGAILRIYSGSQPGAGGGSVAGNTLLAPLTCNSVFAGAAANGTLTLNSISPATSAAATGVATFMRLVKSDGTTFIWDGTVSTVAAGTGDLRLDDTSIVLGGTVAISSAVLTEGNAP
jgi:hypothetical protein